MLSKFSIRAKIIATVAFLLLALIGTGTFAILQLRAINANAVDIETNWLPSVRTLGELRASAITYRIGAGEYPFFEAKNPYGIFALLFSPGGSMFVYSPIAVLALAGIREMWRRFPRETAIGGVFSIAYPEVSTRLADAKLEHAAATSARYVVSTDLACLMHLDGRRRKLDPTRAPQPIHIADLLASGLPVASR